jgi:hypothetical protein
MRARASFGRKRPKSQGLWLDVHRQERDAAVSFKAGEGRSLVRDRLRSRRITIFRVSTNDRFTRHAFLLGQIVMIREWSVLLREGLIAECLQPMSWEKSKSYRDLSVSQEFFRCPLSSDTKSGVASAVRAYHFDR